MLEEGHLTKRLYTSSESTSVTWHPENVTETLACTRFARPGCSAQQKYHETLVYKRFAGQLQLRVPDIHLERLYKRFVGHWNSCPQTTKETIAGKRFERLKRYGKAGNASAGCHKRAV